MSAGNLIIVFSKEVSMTQVAAQKVSSLWPMMGALGTLQTPSRRSEFGVDLSLIHI